MGYIERRTLSGEALRRLCVNKNWYTLGDNAQYRDLFALLTENYHAAEMTVDRLAEIAENIYWHSSEEDCADGYLEITSIMHDLSSACRSAFFEQ